MNDRELLELAAKAAGLHLSWGPKGCLPYLRPPHCNVRQVLWNPLGDDGDAFRLATNLSLDVLQDELHVSIKRWNKSTSELDHLVDDPIDIDRLTTTRRAIVKAAARIGEETQDKA